METLSQMLKPIVFELFCLPANQYFIGVIWVLYMFCAICVIVYGLGGETSSRFNDGDMRARERWLQISSILIWFRNFYK